MLNFFRALLLLLLIPAATLRAATPLEGQDHSYASLLLSPASVDVKLAAKSLARNLTANVDVFDLAANTLWLACSGQRSLDADTQAWLAIALGKSRNARYRTILTACTQSPESKVQEHSEESLEDLPDSPASQFTGGSLIQEEVAAQLTTSVARDAPNRSAGKFSGVAFGESLERVYRTLGLPDAVEAVTLAGPSVRRGPVHVPTSISSLIVVYNNLGVITFILPSGEGARWNVASITSAGTGDPAVPRVAQVRQSLSSPDPKFLKSVATDLIARGEKDPLVLDLLADRIGWGRNTEDELMGDSLAWLCKVIGSAGDGRYKTFLVEVGNTAKTRRLRKHASEVAEALPDSRLPPYRPGQAGAVAAPATEPDLALATTPVVIPIAVPSEPSPPSVTPPIAAVLSSAPETQNVPVVAERPVSPAPVRPGVSGQAVKLRAGAQMRGRPMSSADPVKNFDTQAPVVLKSSTRNSDGVWWYASANGRGGWIIEKDLDFD